MSLSKLWDIVEDRGVWRAAVHGVAKSGTWLSSWTTTAIYIVTAGWRGCYLFQLIGEQKESEKQSLFGFKTQVLHSLLLLHYNRITYALLAGSIAQSCLTPCDPPGLKPTRLLWSRGFSRQEYWSGLPFPPPGHLPNPKNQMHISWVPCIAADSFPLSHQGNPVTVSPRNNKILLGKTNLNSYLKSLVFFQRLMFYFANFQ